jgi:hypothetical protein
VWLSAGVVLTLGVSLLGNALAWDCEKADPDQLHDIQEKVSSVLHDPSPRFSEFPACAPGTVAFWYLRSGLSPEQELTPFEAAGWDRISDPYTTIRYEKTVGEYLYSVSADGMSAEAVRLDAE